MAGEQRAGQIFAAAAVQAIAHPASGRYVHSAFLESGVRFSATHARGMDEFGVDFTGVGLSRAADLDGLLRLFGLVRRDNRTDLHAYRWIFAPLPDGSVNRRTVVMARTIAEAILGRSLED